MGRFPIRSPRILSVDVIFVIFAIPAALTSDFLQIRGYLANIGRLAELRGILPVFDSQAPRPSAHVFLSAGLRLIGAKTSQLYQLIVGQHCLSCAAMCGRRA